MSQTGTDNLIIDYILKSGEEVNEDNYLALAFPGVSGGKYTDEMRQEWLDVKAELE